MGDILYAEECFKIQGAIFEVYKELGCGFLESVYQEALSLELKDRLIPYEEQKVLNVIYKGKCLKQIYKPDFICYDKIIVEIKAVSNLTKEHEAQLHNYLKATNTKLGLLVNFGHFPKAEIKRIAR